jgi:hypothetical protein
MFDHAPSVYQNTLIPSNISIFWLLRLGANFSFKRFEIISIFLLAHHFILY